MMKLMMDIMVMMKIIFIMICNLIISRISIQIKKDSIQNKIIIDLKLFIFEIGVIFQM